MLFSLLPLLSLLASPALAAPAALDARATGPVGAQQCQGKEIYAAYWRTWNDAATGFQGMQARMDSLPKGTDIALVFDANGADATPYFDVLKNTYVPKLHAQGTKLARSLGIEVLRAIPVPSDGNYDKIAQSLIAQYVTPANLDGLDFDIEEVVSGSEATHFVNIIRGLSKYLGPKGKAGTLLIYDTNQDSYDEFFPRIADVVSYVFLQAYGRSVSRLQTSWNTYAPHIDSCRFAAGFSFYEEKADNIWHDTFKPFSTSRAGQYAAWQPIGGRKGGVFAYAADRDWKAEGDDTISAPTYEFAHDIFHVQGKE